MSRCSSSRGNSIHVLTAQSVPSVPASANGQPGRPKPARPGFCERWRIGRRRAGRVPPETPASRRCTMDGQQPNTRHELMAETTAVVTRAAAIVVGLVLMVVAIGMGVALVLLPGAIPVGFAGLFIFLWGL